MKRYIKAILGAVLLLAGASMLADTTEVNGRRVFNDSIKTVPVQSSGKAAHISRPYLTSAELGATINFVISLKMPNFSELQTKLAMGQKFTANEMKARYLPAIADYLAVQKWLRTEGFTLTQEDPSQTNIFAKGTILQIQKSLQTTFARVATDEGEFSSAIIPPSLPLGISAPVLGISGLQPHRRMHAQSMRPNVKTLSGSNYEFVFPSDILNYYNAPSNLNGAGQTIAIIMEANVNTNDLERFYSDGGITRSGSFTDISIDNGPTSPSSDADDEAALDVEWSSGIAPGANIRLYAIPDLSDASIIAALTQIYADSTTYNIGVTSMSFGGDESAAYTQAYNQAFALNSAVGITNIASSGDNGSYAPDFTTNPEYPASDPDVTGVGGTTIQTSGAPPIYVGETLYSAFTPTDGYGNATGGGISTIFPRPVWQADGGSLLTNQTMRCVPDVAAFWGTMVNQDQGWQGYACIIINGQPQGEGGTSLSAPIWAGVVAMIDQARAVNGAGNIGDLGPDLYTLHGTSALKDIDASIANTMSQQTGLGTATGPPWATFSNTNGAYSVGPGYDLCTGLGRPDIANLTAMLNGTRFIVFPTVTVTPNYLGGTVTAIKPNGFSTTP